MIRILYLPILMLVLLLTYNIYSQDFKIQHLKEFENTIILYSKIKCIYCTKAKEFFENNEIPFIDIDITWDKDLHRKLETETHQRTVPYIFIKGKFIGGYDQLIELVKNKKLFELTQ